jgi:hypothetical protein
VNGGIYNARWVKYQDMDSLNNAANRLHNASLSVYIKPRDFGVLQYTTSHHNSPTQHHMQSTIETESTSMSEIPPAHEGHRLLQTPKIVVELCGHGDNPQVYRLNTQISKGILQHFVFFLAKTVQVTQSATAKTLRLCIPSTAYITEVEIPALEAMITHLQHIAAVNGDWNAPLTFQNIEHDVRLFRACKLLYMWDWADQVGSRLVQHMQDFVLEIDEVQYLCYAFACSDEHDIINAMIANLVTSRLEKKLDDEDWEWMTWFFYTELIGTQIADWLHGIWNEICLRIEQLGRQTAIDDEEQQWQMQQQLQERRRRRACLKRMVRRVKRKLHCV